MSTKDKLLELQRRIAIAKGYTRLELLDEPAGRLAGVLHAEEGRVLIPRWPWNIEDAKTLLDEIDTGPVNPPGYFMDVIQTANGPRILFTLAYCEAGVYLEADTEPEAISLGWCENHGVDTRGL
jgi:hypothetical protein